MNSIEPPRSGQKSRAAGHVEGGSRRFAFVRATPWNRSLPPQERDKRILAAIAGAGLLVAAVWGLVFGLGALVRTRGWSESTGTVVSVRKSGADQGALIRFEDSDGIGFTFWSDFTGDSRELEVKYPSRDPRRAQTSADLTNDRNVGLAVLAIAGPAAVLLMLWSTGLIGKTEPIASNSS
jgi:hypothetical protein